MYDPAIHGVHARVEVSASECEMMMLKSGSCAHDGSYIDSVCVHCLGWRSWRRHGNQAWDIGKMSEICAEVHFVCIYKYI